MRAWRGLLVLIVLVGCESTSPSDGGPSGDAGELPLPCLEVTPTSLDFGEVELTSAPVQKVTVVNRSSFARLVHARSPTGPSFLSVFDQGDLLVQAGKSREVEVRFFPTDARLHLGVLELTAGENCDATVTLRALGGGSASFERSIVDFGFVPPGQSKTLELRFTNTRRESVRVAQLWLEGAGFPAFMLDLPAVPFDLPPMGSRSFVITATPPDDSLYEVQFLANTSLGLERALLSVAGGAPVVEVPAVIDVSLAPFERWVSPPPSVRRSLQIRNASTAPPSSASQLELIPPLVTVELADGGAIGLSPDRSSPEIGFMLRFSSLGPGESGELTVSVSPNAVGLRSYRIHVFTNDPVTPESVVTLNVNAMTLGPCFVRVEPQTDLNLTRVSFNRTRGTVSFINEGPNRCVVDDPRVDTSGYWIVDPVPQVIVEPWQTGTLTIEGPGQGQSGTGTLSFRVLNSDSQPEMLLLHVPQ